MKTCKLLPIVLLVGACTLSAHAQKLKYVPEAIKGVKAVPYVVKPKLPATVRTGLSVPVVRPQAALAVRPNLSAAVERVIKAQVTMEERMKRLVLLEEYRYAGSNKKLEIDLAMLEQYAREHNGKLPPYNGKTEASILRTETARSIADLQSMRILPSNHPLVLWYHRLSYIDRKQPKEKSQQQQREEQLIQEIRQQEELDERRAWHQVLLQDAAWKAQLEDIMPDPAKNAEKAAALGEQQLSVPGTITDDYVEQLLNFYNKLDPLGTGTIQ